jgi:hypothetical protein
MSRDVVRVVAFAIGGLFALASLLFAHFGHPGPAGITGCWAFLLLVGLLIERWRYKRLTSSRPGPDWQVTDERFVDPETGKLVTVYFHPATGERRYVSS